MQIRDAAVVITGGRGRLGEHVCRAFLTAGAQVLSADIIAPDKGAVVAGATQVQCDVSTAAGAQTLVDAALKAFGRLDVLVNNAAINREVRFQDLEALDEDLWARIFTVNLTGPFLCAKAVAPVMRRQGQGRIINVASSAGLIPAGSSIPYAVAKAGLIHLTRCLALGLGPEILVTAVAPGLMQGTGISANLSPELQQRAINSAALRRTTALQDVADQVVTLARSDSTTGATLAIDAGTTYH